MANVMQDFHLIKVKNALPFVHHLMHMGAPVEQLAKEAGLPLRALKDPDGGVIGEYALWQFIELAARKTGCGHLGYDCAQAYPISSSGEFGELQIRTAATLKHCLEKFCEDVLLASTASYYSLYKDVDRHWFRRIQAFGRDKASWQAEQYVIAIVIQIIRQHTGGNWLPGRIRISSLEEPVATPLEWRKIKLEWGCDATEIEVSNSTLALPFLPLSGSVATVEKISRKRQRIARPNFTNLVETQIEAHCTGIENAATQTGLSVSTLQRRLHSMNTSYSEILESLRIKLARQLLSQTQTPIAEIAVDLGYQHLSNFSRAFKKKSGLSPLLYRAKS